MDVVFFYQSIVKIERQLIIKMGWQASAMVRRGVVTDKSNLNRQIKADNEQMKGLRLGIVILQDQQKQELTQKHLARQKGTASRIREATEQK